MHRSRYVLMVGVLSLVISACGASQQHDAARTFIPDARSATATSGSTYTVKPGLLFVVDSIGEYPYDDVQIYDVKKKNPSPLAYIREGVSQPVADCIDGNKILYVVNEGANSISEYALGQTVPLRVITSGLDTPAYCAIDHQGDLWVTNIGADDVAEYLPGKTKPHEVITDGLTRPDGIAIDHSGNIFVGNLQPSATSNVQVYAAGSTSPSRTITDGVQWPTGLGVNAAGTLFVANLIPGNITEYRQGASKPARTITKDMNGPAAVTFAENGWMYITNVGVSGGGSGPPSVILEYPPRSRTPSQKMISKDLQQPQGTAYYPPLLP